MDKNDANKIFCQIWIRSECASKEIVHCSNCLYSGKTASSDYHAQQLVTGANGAFKVCLLQKINQLIAQMNRISKRLHGHGIVFQSRHTVEVRRGSQSYDEVVVINFVRMPFWTVNEPNSPRWEIDVLNF